MNIEDEYSLILGCEKRRVSLSRTMNPTEDCKHKSWNQRFHKVLKAMSNNQNKESKIVQIFTFSHFVCFCYSCFFTPFLEGGVLRN